MLDQADGVTESTLTYVDDYYDWFIYSGGAVDGRCTTIGEDPSPLYDELWALSCADGVEYLHISGHSSAEANTFY